MIDLKAFLGSMRWVVVLLPSFFRVRWTVFARFVHLFFDCFRAFERVLAAQKLQIDWKLFTVHLVTKCGRIDLFRG